MRRGILLSLAIVLAGCGATNRSAAPSPRPAASSTACAFAGNAAAKTEGGPDTVMLLTDVRAASDECFDRVAFEFRPGPPGGPGYQAEYRQGPFYEDGSGAPVSVEGKEFIVVRIHPAATADLSAPGPPITYKGPKTIPGTGLRHVVQIRKTGDFESVLTWVIGLSGKRPFAVTRLPDPPRLVIDVG